MSKPKKRRKPTRIHPETGKPIGPKIHNSEYGKFKWAADMADNPLISPAVILLSIALLIILGISIIKVII